MRLILNECLPRQLGMELTGHLVMTVKHTQKKKSPTPLKGAGLRERERFFAIYFFKSATAAWAAARRATGTR